MLTFRLLGNGDMIDIDHSGPVTSAPDAEPAAVLTIPSLINHDAPIPREDLETEFLSQLPSDPKAPLIRVKSRTD